MIVVAAYAAIVDWVKCAYGKSLFRSTILEAMDVKRKWGGGGGAEG